MSKEIIAHNQAIEKEIAELQALLESVKHDEMQKRFLNDKIKTFITQLKPIIKEPVKIKSPKQQPAVKKLNSKETDARVDDQLSETRDAINAERKPLKESVADNKRTRFTNAMKAVSNALKEGYENDPAMLTKIDKTLTLFEIKCKEDFIGLKRI